MGEVQDIQSVWLLYLRSGTSIDGTSKLQAVKLIGCD